MKRVLIIEDEQSIAELERDYLEINGFETEISLFGDEGLNLALAKDFDLVLLDVMLPNISGFEICKKIRQVKDIPIIMVTAKKDEIDKIRGFGLGADDYIVKPFSPNELIARIRAHLSRYDRLLTKNLETTTNEIFIRGLHIDRSARKVFVDNRGVVFTTKEFDVLVFLATNPNQVLSKVQLFEKIWGYDSVGDITTVTVHIRKIREKIERDPSNPVYIETVWGAGYRFKGD
ncbi:DNA-binding response regulator, OmpR family, contains REC and winged-helix (wHTH) domain [Mesobacillus persicus]|uniref:DNA-binding response regulator, OmpR family, contains REC and winged-helix (WHTH) domain n=1 Tax=Mesobacillus persicus TaxID=930146 RepID=A0A1H7ZQJ6_9BACI|nr:response regulator transcription factor [Mesobacillus persicus]SEM59667.1 DNA-binding response regulator, OmpR family, contains REC and winged-helix (wHTH) domain [Mesobacillus persicus]